jgi:hypothetical protein
MKKRLVALLSFAALTANTIAYAGMLPQTGVNGSFHDITYLGAQFGFYNQDDFQRVCIFCHTPHSAQANVGYVLAPLWNHYPSNLPPAQAYAWAAPANLSIGFAQDYLIGPSRLCESCHDGLTAVDAHGPTTLGTAQGRNNGGHALNNTGRHFGVAELATTHPIGFLYSDAYTVRPGELVEPTANYFIDAVPEGPTTNTRDRSGWLWGNKVISDTLYGGYVTCASCHDVHNMNNAINPAPLSGGPAPNYFIWAPEKNSALCLSCHIK